MGAAESTSIFSSHQTLLDRFVGTAPIALNEPFWNDLTSFSHLLPKLKLDAVDNATRDACSRLVINNSSTKNFARLLFYLIKTVHLNSFQTKKFPFKAINVVAFSRVFLKHFIEFSPASNFESDFTLTLNEDEVAETDFVAGEYNMIDEVISKLIFFSINLDVNANTYFLHLEIVNFFLVMSSTQLFPNKQNLLKSNLLFLSKIVSLKSLASSFTRKLLMNYISQMPLPNRVPFFSSAFSDQPSEMLKKVGSAATAVLLIPYYTFSYFLKSSIIPQQKCPLSDNSLFLLILLIHYENSSDDITDIDSSLHDAPKISVVNQDLNTTQSQGQSLNQVAIQMSDKDSSSINLENAQKKMIRRRENYVRLALDTARDSAFDIKEDSIENGFSILIPFAALYETLGRTLTDDKTTLLLYSLVHKNIYFLEYVLVRADLDTLIVPLLEMLYNANKLSSNLIYMILIIFLILTQDASFNSNIHKLILPIVPWYKERILAKISLGSLIVVVLIRTVKYNISKLKDVYLLTNCLATLANMAPHVSQLNSYSSQRLISLFQMLSKKYSRLSLNAEKLIISEDQTSEPTELHIYTDFLRIVLEIINSILTYALPRNPEIVYALLHRQEVFSSFRTHPRFYELLDNIFAVVEFFNVRMDNVNKGSDWSVEKVLSVVVQNTRAWRGESMKMFTELRFTYEEEMNSEEFFIPYILSLISSQSGIFVKQNENQPSSRQSEFLDDGFDNESYDVNSEVTLTPKTEV